jgi:hypothetical protein
VRVLRTRSRTARQVALKLEIAICSMPSSSFLHRTMVYDHGQQEWVPARG